MLSSAVIHTGSEDQMLVVAQNFPGTGIQTVTEEEVAPVANHWTNSKQIECAVFTLWEQTGVRPVGLMGYGLAFRYRVSGGISGDTNPRVSIRPLAADHGVDTISAWRSSGGCYQ